MYLLKKIVKNKAYKASLMYSTFEVVPVSKLLCPKYMVSFISKICHLDWIQKKHRHYINTTKPFG